MTDSTAAEPLRGRAVAGARWNALATGSVFGIQLLQLAVLARLLEPAAFGLMAMAMVALGLAQAVADLGAGNALVQRQSRDPDLLSTAYWTVLLAGLAFAAAVYALAPAAGAFFGRAELPDLLRAGILLFPLVAVGQPYFALHQVNLAFKPIALGEMAGAALGAFVAVGAAAAGKGALSLVYGQLAATGMRSLVLSVTGWRSFKPSLRLSPSDLKPLLGFCLFQLGERTVAFLRVNLDKLLVGKLLGAAVLGQYNVAYQMVLRPLMLVNPIVTRVLFPLIARIRDDDARICRGYLEGLRLIAFFTMPIYLGLLAAAPVFIPVFLGPAWNEVTGAFQVLCALGVIMAVGNPVGALLLAKGRADWGFWLNVLGLAVFAGAAFLGARWGLTGVAWALLLGCAGVMLPADILMRRRLVGMSLGSYLSALARPFFCALAMSGAVALALNRLPLSGAAGLFALFLLGATVYGLLSFRWQRETWRTLVGAAGRENGRGG